jgi:hypothetical protein
MASRIRIASIYVPTSNRRSSFGVLDFRWERLTVAKSNPDSLEYDLMKMTTPPFWTYLNKSLKEYFNIRPFLNGVMQMSTPVESRIVNVSSFMLHITLHYICRHEYFAHHVDTRM